MLDLDILSVTLAQDGVAAPPGEGTAVPAGAEGAGAGGAAPGTPPSPGFFSPGFVIVMIGVLVFMILISSGGRRGERKRREAMFNTMRKHDRVLTSGGIIGSIVEIKPDHVVLKVDESANIRITFARSAIQQVLSSSEKKEPAADAAAGD